MEIHYVLENAAKNVWRTKGKLGTLFLLIILGVFCYFFLLYNSFIQHWQTVSALDALNSADGMIVVSHTLPIQMAKSMASLLYICFFVVLTVYAKRSITQFAYIQREDFFTQSLLGEKTSTISLEFGLQAVLYPIISQPIALIIANALYQKSIQGLITTGEFASLQASFEFPLAKILSLFFISCLYVFLGNFLYVYRYLIKEFKKQEDYEE